VFSILNFLTLYFLRFAHDGIKDRETKPLCSSYVSLFLSRLCILSLDNHFNWGEAPIAFFNSQKSLLVIKIAMSAEYPHFIKFIKSMNVCKKYEDVEIVAFEISGAF